MTRSSSSCACACAFAFAFAFTFAFASPAAAADPLASPAPVPPLRAPLVFVSDPRLGMEAGVRTFDSLGRIVFRYDEAIPPLVTFDESRTGGKIGAIVGRFAQYLFVDTAIAGFDAVVIHEVFGHGARARDLRQPAQFDFALPGIYCVILGDGDNCTSHAQVTGGSGGRERDLLVNAGGVEANYLTAYWLDVRMMQAKGWMHQGDVLLYGASKLAYANSLLSADLDRAGTMTGGDDAANYVTNLQDRFNLPTGGDRIRISRQLRTAYLWNLVDPMLFYATYASLYRGVVRGERWTQAPLPTIGDVSLYATPRFGLSPWGAEHYVDLFAARDAELLSVYGRVGSSGLASYTGAGVRVMGLRAGDRLTMGGELDVWSQPETLLDDRAVYERPQIRGMNAGVTTDLRLYRNLGLTARVAYKTKGYLTGQPIGEGFYGYFGVTIAFDR